MTVTYVEIDSQVHRDYISYSKHRKSATGASFLNAKYIITKPRNIHSSAYLFMKRKVIDNGNENGFSICILNDCFF